MQLFDTSMIALTDAMAGANVRQQALAANIANANTPGYQRVDVDFESAIARAIASPQAGSLSSLQFSPQPDSTADPVRVDQSNVDINREMSELSQNTLDEQAVASIMTNRIGILKTAIGATS